MKTESNKALTFDIICDADLHQVYEQGKEEMLRDCAFRALLSCTDTIEKLEELAYTKEKWQADWTTKELIEISNYFRLLSSPENEIRLYRECKDEAFRSTPRVREFYILALNKARKPTEAIQEGSRIIAEGGHNALIWAAIGESFTARMFFAEQLIQALSKTGNDPVAIDSHLITKLPDYFQDVELADMEVSRAQFLRLNNLLLAISIFRRGFRESGASFPGLGWIMRTIDYQADLLLEHTQLEQNRGTYRLRESEKLRLRVIDNEMKVVEKDLESQTALVGIVLELQGGRESLDYWTHAGRLMLAVISGASLPTIRVLISHLFATVDAEFELAITVSELQRIKNNYTAMRDARYTLPTKEAFLNKKIECAELAIAECDALRIRFRDKGKHKGCVGESESHNTIDYEPLDCQSTFLFKTFNFRALTSNFIPLYISGGLGRVGSRVPDLLINRRVQEDLVDIVKTKILQALPLKDREDPKAVIARIQKYVGSRLRIGDLQDLQSSAHSIFDIRSDGLITLSGIDIDMRKNTRTGTDLTAALLMQNGDCRETMYLNGALFACWQQMQVKKRIANAMLCLELNFQEGFERILNDEIPAIMRYQLRGGHFSVYVDSIAMSAKYNCQRMAANDAVAMFRPYGVDELRAGKPLDLYELENSKIKVNYTDGSYAWIEPKDSLTGKWRPIENKPIPGGGIPIIPKIGTNYENIKSIQLLNLVEEHSLTLLYDEEQQAMEFCDGFYNEALFESPYKFGSGPVNLGDIKNNNGLIRAGSRTLIYPDGSLKQHPVYLEFLPFSKTDYETALVEGDILGTIQLMGRTFRGDLNWERQRLEEETSSIPTLLEKIQEWQVGIQKSTKSCQKIAEKKLSKMVLDLVRKLPEHMRLIKVTTEEPLIIEEAENTYLYLVLNGKLSVYRQGKQLRDINDELVVSTTGSILGEISALSNSGASATVLGDAFVLCIPMNIIQEQLLCNPALRNCMEELADYRA